MALRVEMESALRCRGDSAGAVVPPEPVERLVLEVVEATPVAVWVRIAVDPVVAEGAPTTSVAIRSTRVPVITITVRLSSIKTS